MVRGASFSRGFDVDEIMQIGWFRFMQEIVVNRNNIEYYALFDLEVTMVEAVVKSMVC